MKLQAAYQQFLAAPNSSLLAEDATLSYITTTTVFSGATEVIKHYNSLRNQVKKKSEDVVDVVEGQNSLWLEVATTLEFVTSGGVYLPSLDDNFLADRTVVVPIGHVVRFDSHGKIKGIRQNWDQGCLLKQLDIIGKTGRNWPIRDASDQLKMITKLQGPTNEDRDSFTRSRSTSSNALRDPHASLALFGNREEIEAPLSNVISPKAGNRPRQRSFTEILGDQVEGDVTGRERSPSKAGAGKNFAPNRLFDADQEAETPETPEKPSSDRVYRPNPKKYQHFDFADGSDPQDTPKPAAPSDNRGKSRHESSWDFKDFVTPQKALPSRGLARKQDVRHWSTVEGEAEETPVSKPALPKPRRDAETHFQLVDDGEAKGPRLGSRPRGQTHNERLGLYENNLYDDNGVPPKDGQALANITNLKDRSKDFESHFQMADDSPQPSRVGKPNVPEDRKKAVKMMDANWEAYDQSPNQKENQPIAARNNGKKLAPEEGGRVYQVAGNGMGSKKGARGWSIGDESDEEVVPAVLPKKPAPKANRSAVDSRPPEEGGRVYQVAGNGMGSKNASRGWSIGDESEEEVVPVVLPKKPAPKSNRSAVDSRPPEEGGRVYQVAGDGMGSKKGSRGWSIGDESEEDIPVYTAPKKPAPQAQKTDKDFWDF